MFSGVTILLSLTVFSQVLADTMPATSDAIPLLGKNKCQKVSSLLNLYHGKLYYNCYLHTFYVQLLPTILLLWM